MTYIYDSECFYTNQRLTNNKIQKFKVKHVYGKEGCNFNKCA